MFNFHTEFAGRYRWVLHDPDGNAVQESGWIKNLVLDEGLHLLGSGGPDGDLDHFGNIYIGQGNTPVAKTDLTLDSLIDDSFHGPRNTSIVTSNNRYAYTSGADKYYSVEGHAVRFGPFKKSTNVAEVGLGNAKGGNYYMLTRALIKDTDGEVTTVSVPKGYYFDVFYELWQFFPLGDEDYQISVHIDDEDKVYNVKSRLALAGNSGYGEVNNNVTRVSTSSSEFGYYALLLYNGDLRTVDSSPEYTGDGYSSFGLNTNRWAYDRDTRTSKSSWDIDAGYGNVEGGIRSMMVKTTRGAYQIRFGAVEDDAPLPKDRNKTLNIQLSVSWGRYDGELED